LRKALCVSSFRHQLKLIVSSLRLAGAKREFSMSNQLEALVSTREGRILLSLALQLGPEIMDCIKSATDMSDKIVAIIQDEPPCMCVATPDQLQQQKQIAPVGLPIHD